jgi:hypothetical protein
MLLPGVRVLPSLLLLCAVRCAAVESLDVADLRLGAGLIGGPATATGGGQRAEFGSGGQLRLDALLGVDLNWFGALAGVGGWHERRTGDGLERTVLGGRVCAGPYIPCGPVDIQVLPWAGTGRAELAQGALADTGTVRAWGVDAGLAAVAHSAVVAIEVGWQADVSDHRLGPTDWDYRASGARAGAAVGWRF